MNNTSTQIQDLANKINNFPYQYEMSDNDAKWTKGDRAEKQIKRELKELTPEQLTEVKAGITITMDAVNRYFADFFNNLPEPSNDVQVESTEATATEATTTTSEPSMRSKVMTTAWTYIRSNVAANLSQALKMAWKRIKTIKLLRKGIAYLTFFKADGTERKAIATLRNGNYSYENKNSTKKINPNIIKFWDIEKRAFRACRIDRLIEVAA